MEPFDLDAARAQRREAAGEPATFTFGGEQYHVPPSSEWPLGVRDLLVGGDLQGAMRELLNGQWERFHAAGPTMGDVGDLHDWISESNGMRSAGNSSGSSGTSRSTPKRSRRTSSVTTTST